MGSPCSRRRWWGLQDHSDSPLGLFYFFALVVGAAWIVATGVAMLRLREEPVDARGRPCLDRFEPLYSPYLYLQVLSRTSAEAAGPDGLNAVINGLVNPGVESGA